MSRLIEQDRKDLQTQKATLKLLIRLIIQHRSIYSYNKQVRNKSSVKSVICSKKYFINYTFLDYVPIIIFSERGELFDGCF